MKDSHHNLIKTPNNTNNSDRMSDREPHGDKRQELECVQNASPHFSLPCNHSASLNSGATDIMKSWGPHQAFLENLQFNQVNDSGG